MGFPTTATFDSLIDEVIHNLSGFTQQIDAQIDRAYREAEQRS